MIDITLDGTNVIIEGTMKFDLQKPGEALQCLVEVLDATRYSGEAIELWVVEGPIKRRYEHWSTCSCKL